MKRRIIAMPYPHPIENIMRTTMEQIKGMVDVNTIVGDPMMSGEDTMIVPVSKLSLGFLSGGGEYSKGESILRRQDNAEYVDDIRHPFAGTSAAGMSVTPMAFLVVHGDSVQVIPAQYDCTIDRIVELFPRTLEEITKVAKKMQSKKSKCSHDGDDTDKESTKKETFSFSNSYEYSNSDEI